MNKDFCIFILTHGRPDKVITYTTLINAKCLYPIYFIIDNEDKLAEKYYQNFGNDNVIMFDKLVISKTFDTADNFENRKCIVYARNACFEIAKKLGYKYFLQLDDDYTNFTFKFNDKDEFCTAICKNLMPILNSMLEFYINTPFKTIAFGQGGDYIGGKDGTYAKRFIKRKAMNSFFCSTDRPFTFVGRINEDVNTYCSEGQKGVLFGSVMSFALHQLPTQQNSGGMTETYIDSGTYLKSFYTVLFCPSFVKIWMMGNHNESKRLHHKISWNNAVPKILSESVKKL